MNDYPYVIAWGKMMRSEGYYIENQLRKAREDGAPVTAVYRGDDGAWVTLDQCHPDTQRQLERLLTD